ncbi:MAG: hypothetical protein QNK36_20820 [Colwellia sp.]|nr:hypothetical protein [Colwellia sp.]
MKITLSIFLLVFSSLASFSLVQADELELKDLAPDPKEVQKDIKDGKFINHSGHLHKDGKETDARNLNSDGTRSNTGRGKTTKQQ